MIDCITSVVAKIYAVPLGLGLVASADGAGGWVQRRSSIEPHELGALVRATEAVIMGAYDGESVIVWVREGSSLI